MAVSATRKPPLPATFTEPRVKGQCRWCGEPTTSNRRYWHPQCHEDYQIVTSDKVRRGRVWARDHGICKDCGKVRWRVAQWCRVDRWVWYDADLGETPMTSGRMLDRWDQQETYLEGEWGPTSLVSFQEYWEIDHEIPLWKAAILPDAKRLWYFTIENLATRCVECHKRKNQREAMERAKFKRIKNRQGMRSPKEARQPLPF